MREEESRARRQLVAELGHLDRSSESARSDEMNGTSASDDGGIKFP